MTSSRTLVVSVLGAVLLAAPVICAQLNVEPSVASVIPQPRPAIQELKLQPQRFLGFSLQSVPVSVPSVGARDFSRYREFQFGMSVPAIVKHAGLEASEAQVIHQRPAVIQELKWEPQVSPDHSPQTDSVKTIFFSFYNGELFRMVVNYDRYRTEGLTNEDMIEALSVKYGPATRPDAKIILFSTFQVYNDSEKVIARWEDSRYSYNLYRSSYQPTFGMLAFSKQLDALAQTAIVEAIRLDEQEAPRRDALRQKKEDDENRAADEKTRRVNKATVRP